MDALSFWLARLEPVIRAETEGEITIVLANRTGIENEAVYAGTSAVIGILAGEVKLYGILGRGENELLIVDTEKPPLAKLFSNPESTAWDLLTKVSEILPATSTMSTMKSDMFTEKFDMLTVTQEHRLQPPLNFHCLIPWTCFMEQTPLLAGPMTPILYWQEPHSEPVSAAELYTTGTLFE
jgi:hypothetical protein